LAQETSEKIFRLSNPDMAINLVGINDANLTLIEEGLNVQISPFGDELRIHGDTEAVSLTLQLLEAASKLLAQGIKLSAQDIASAVAMAKRGTLEYFADMYSETLLRDAKGQQFGSKTLGSASTLMPLSITISRLALGQQALGRHSWPLSWLSPR
jgi:phosphate starvation-inducible PhoH-like protein